MSDGITIQIVRSSPNDATSIEDEIEQLETNGASYTTGDLFALLAAATEANSKTARLKMLVDDQLTQRHRSGATKRTVRLGGWEFRMSLSRQWDREPDRVALTLDRMVKKGVITRGEAVECAPVVPSVKPDGRALSALLSRLSGTSDADDLMTTCREEARWSATPLAVVAEREARR